jgi:thiamine pyrophosphokinase
MHVLLLLGGQPPSPELTRTVFFAVDLCVAADSGYLALEAIGVYPDILTGDFDSVGRDWTALPVKVVHRPEQTATDFEKALQQLPDETTSITILGGTGRRVDHFLTNLLIAASIRGVVSVRFEDDCQQLFRVTPECSCELELKPGQVVSLIPLVNAGGVSSSGLRWNLEETEMGPQAQLGQSNVSEEKHISIRITSGILWVVVNREGQA